MPERPGAFRPMLRAVALALLGASACSRDEGRRPDTDAASCGSRESPARTEGWAVQVGAFADSANAAALSATLAGEGWEVDSGREDTGRRLWRVRVAPGQSREAADLTAHALRSRFAGAVRASTPPFARVPLVSVTTVNRGTHGMAASSRWAYSPDGCALIVVEDPVSVEADALPNAFVYAHDGTGTLIQPPSVWDVAPSSDWKRLAYSLAFTESAREQDSLGAAQWEAFAQRAGWPADSVRRGAFQTSGMAYVYGIARPVVQHVDSAAVPKPLPMLGGWRVGWRGDRLAVGLNPRMTNDDAPASGWLLVDAQRALVMGRADSGATMDAVSWEDGPTLDISISVEPPPSPRRPTGARGEPTVRTRDGWIELRADANTDRWIRVLPGVALATTRAGRSVVALVPWPEAREYDHKWQLALVRIQ